MSSDRHIFAPHQRRAMRYARSHDSIALFMEMRLGKSPVAIRWAHELRRVLLVAPLSTLLGKLNWQGELAREGLTPTLLTKMTADERVAAIRPSRLTHGRLIRRLAPGWFLVNYEALRTQPWLLELPWQGIILDESTRIRSPKAQITKLLIKRTSHIPHKAILTGLPNPESSLDYCCQFLFLDGEFLGTEDYWQFRGRHYHKGYSGWDWTANRGTVKRVKDYVQERAFVLTRKQAKVGSAKIRQQRSVELNNAQKRAMREIETDFAIDGKETKWVTVQQTWMQRIAGGFHPSTLELISDAKIRLLEQLVMDEFRHEPVVVWFRFNDEIQAVRRWMLKRHRKKGFRVEYVHGKIPASDRPIIQQRFQDGATNLLLMQVKLGRYGWNLSRSSTAIYYSNTYEFEDRSQSEDRIIHLTKKNDCLYLDLVTIGTPDEDVVEALSEKRMNARLFAMRLKKGTMDRWLQP